MSTQQKQKSQFTLKVVRPEGQEEYDIIVSDESGVIAHTKGRIFPDMSEENFKEMQLRDLRQLYGEGVDISLI